MARESIEVLKECEAFLEGHFLLSSGRHSGAYCQMAYLQQYPDKCAEVMAHVAEKLKDTDVDVIVGPAMGGIVYAYELGRQLGKRAIFTERVDNVMTLKRFAIHPGERCIIAEDVVTTGVSSLETKRVIEEAGGICLGITCLCCSGIFRLYLIACLHRIRIICLCISISISGCLICGICIISKDQITISFCHVIADKYRSTDICKRLFYRIFCKIIIICTIDPEKDITINTRYIFSKDQC